MPKKSGAAETVIRVVLLLVWVAAAVIVSQLVVGYIMVWVLGKETFSQAVPTAIYSALSYILALMWIMFATPKIKIGFKAKKENEDVKRRANNEIAQKEIERDDLGLRGLPTWTDIGLAPVGFVVSLLLAAGLAALFNLFPWFDAEQVQDVGFSPYIIGVDRVVAFVVLVVIAPIAEELVFRGWLYGKLRKILNAKMSDMGSMIISILLVSLLFGLIHMQWNVGVNVFALSIVLCGMREITGTIYAGILTHMIKNGVAFYLLYILGIS